MSAKSICFWRKFLVLLFSAVCFLGTALLGCSPRQKQPAPPPASDQTDTPPNNDGNGDDTDHNGGNENNNDNADSWNVSGDPVTATLTANGQSFTLTISGSGEMKNWNSAQDVPWHDKADKINSIRIGEGVTRIGDHAFADITVENIVIPQNVQSVGNYALPPDAAVYAYADTDIAKTQHENLTVYLFSATPPKTHDRHWTSWGSSGNITDAPLADDPLYWHYDQNNAPAPWTKRKVLFIGNSFTFYYQIPAQFGAIARDLGHYVETYSVTVPGQTLETHAVSSSNSGVQIDKLLQTVRDFDYIVLQEQSTRPYTDYDKFVNAVRALQRKVNETQDHAHIYLYETWGSPASAGGDSYDKIAEMEQKLFEAYTQAANDLQLKVSYVGRAFTYVKGETSVNLYFGDNRHPGPAGSYLSACVHVATLLGGDPRQTTLVGKDMVVIANEGAQAQPLPLQEADCEILRAAAYRTVFESEQESETYAVRFWYNDVLQESKTVTVGFGFTLPSCQVQGNDKFSGWKTADADTVYAADTRIAYAQIRDLMKEGAVDFYAQTHEMVIAVWGRWITQDNFQTVMNGFADYCEENDLPYTKTAFIYYAGKTQNVDPYFLIKDFTDKAAADGADVIFPCGDNINNAAQSSVAALVKEFKLLGVTLEGNATRYVARLSDSALANAFYTYITTDAAKEILGKL